MSKYEELKAELRRRNMAIVNLYPAGGSAPESEDVYNAEVAAELAEATQVNYERAAAEMHEELVELLSSIPCIKCGLFTACNMSTKIYAIYDAIKRAKAL